MKKIFFSYSRVDGSAFALRLALDLKKIGYDVWIDQEDIRAGSEWDIEIEKALESCDCLLFIETERSVVSNNVLDEVYYALEQHKKVIPLIFVDSKTPFRLQRLQHIDFTADYNSGLTLLTNELTVSNSPEVLQTLERKPLVKPAKSFYAKYSRSILIAGSLIIIMAAIFIYKMTGAGNTSNEILNKVDPEVASLNKDYAGEWDVVDVEPKAKTIKGYMKIEAIDEKKVTIKSYLQFYYFKNNDTSFLTVFNAFVGCSLCIIEKDMKLTADDISIGSRTLEISKGDPANGKRYGDTTMDAGSNKSIQASVTLHFIDNKTAVIKVQKPLAITLAHELVMEPFTYSFKLNKIE